MPSPDFPKNCRVLVAKDVAADPARLKQMLATVMESTTDHIYFKDTESRFVHINRALALFFGLKDPEDAVGKWDFDFFPREAAEQKFQDERHLMETGAPVIDKVEFQETPKGERRWVLTTKMPLRNFDGQIIGSFGSSRDITAIKQANADLSRSREELMEAMKELRSVQLQLIEAEKMKLVGRLAAGVAHEVKNPLAIVAMGMDYMRRQQFEDPNIAVIVQEITDAVKRADNVVRGLLDFSAPQRVVLEPSDVNGLIRQALILARGEFTGGKFEVFEELDPSLPLVRLDPMKMEQAFVNLFTNAAHAMKGGGTLLVRTSSRQLTGLGENVSTSGTFQVGDRLVVAEVLDTGHGLTEDAEGKVFEPFFTTKPTGKGTGLGLTVTKTIIDLHGGTIGIHNRPEGGVCVTITLKADAPL